MYLANSYVLGQLLRYYYLPKGVGEGYNEESDDIDLDELEDGLPKMWRNTWGGVLYEEERDWVQLYSYLGKNGGKSRWSDLGR